MVIMMTKRAIVKKKMPRLTELRVLDPMLQFNTREENAIST
jgi:hypothetical protein